MISLHYLVLHFSGSDNGGGAWYLWWSGFFGDFSLFAAAVVFVRHRQCHVHRCWRLSKHPVGHLMVCGKHHPAVDGRVTVADVEAAHAKATVVKLTTLAVVSTETDGRGRAVLTVSLSDDAGRATSRATELTQTELDELMRWIDEVHA